MKVNLVHPIQIKILIMKEINLHSLAKQKWKLIVATKTTVSMTKRTIKTFQIQFKTVDMEPMLETDHKTIV